MDGSQPGQAVLDSASNRFAANDPGHQGMANRIAELKRENLKYRYANEKLEQAWKEVKEKQH